MVMSFVSFIRAAENGVAKLFLSTHLRAFIDDDNLCANVGVHLPPSCKMRASIFKRGILHITSDCAMVAVAAI